MLPNLFLAGFPKAGTTSLFSWLAAHPEVCGARPKEPGHFLPLRSIYGALDGMAASKLNVLL